MKIAIQGQEASFHDLAARKYFGEDIEIKYCGNFKDVFESLRDHSVDYGVAALENSLFGTINPVYDLLLSNHYTIVGEVYLRVEFCLIGLPGTKLSKVTEVHSQLPALVECETFLSDKLKHAAQIEEYDTAGSVELIKKLNDTSKVAIASAQAAKANGLEILATNIETHHENYTRFAVLQRQIEYVSGEHTSANKTSLILQTPHDTKAGSLFHALKVFAKYDINLSALHSRPIIGRAWHYKFYIDIDIAHNDVNYQSVINQLESSGCKIDILGNYKNGLS